MQQTNQNNALIYLDYAATTPVEQAVAEKMMDCLTASGTFGNPASRSHRLGWEAEELVDEARHLIAELIQADPREIVFTSGATESDNLAIKGAAHFYANQKPKGKHIVTVCTEHKAVLDTCAALEQEGFEVTYLPVLPSGLLDIETVKAALRPDTILLSVMHVNNEIGVIQDIAKLGALCKEKDILFHVDAAQSAGKIPIDVNAMHIDYMSISAHKMYGPKGIGALYVRRTPRVRLAAQIHGGGHERGMRSGTLATHQIVGFGEAARIAIERQDEDMKRLTKLRDRLWRSIESLGDVTLNGDLDQGIGSLLNVSFGGLCSDALAMSLTGLAVSSGSACNSATVDPSFVLLALGRERELALASIRFSLGRHTTEQEIERVEAILKEKIPMLRASKPLWV